MPTTKICAWCSQPFVEPYPYMQRRFCSPLCSSRSMHATKHPGPYEVERTCEHCGKTFTIRRHVLRKTPRKGRFCSASCKSRLINLQPVEERFWANIVLPETPDECWIWIGQMSHDYGVMSVNGRVVRASRLSYEMHYGLILITSLFVCHRCPGEVNPRCVNPEHLYLGTCLDNSNDKVRANRQAHPNTKVTADDVRIIRHMGEEGLPHRWIAEAFHISNQQVGHIIRRLSWAHIP